MIDLAYYASSALRLVTAAILGGIIGAERESENKYAGFRTHILVCVASSLVMITSEFVFRKYVGMSTMDPARLGAQVISGIGFLGAGAIVKEGTGVKGLTTAASLWAVSCVGLATGIGFYEGAILATAITMIVLVTLKKAEKILIRKKRYWIFTVHSLDKPGQLGSIGGILGKYGVSIKDLKILPSEINGYINIRLELREKDITDRQDILRELRNLEGISDIEED